MEFLFERFGAYATAVAFQHEGRAFTYEQIISTTSDYAAQLRESGVHAGEAVVVPGEYSPEVFCLILAIWRAGSVAIPLTTASVIDLETVLEITGAGWMANASPDGVAISHMEGRGAPPILQKFAATGNPGLILFSSGSTGEPKAILHDMEVVSRKFRPAGSPMVAIAFLMLDHFGGINTVLGMLSRTGTVVTVADRSVATVCRAVQDYRVEVLPTTPTFLTLLARSGAMHEFDLSSLRRITYGTEVMPQGTLDRVRNAFPGVRLQQTYGLSELGVMSSKSREDGSLWVAIGGEGFETKVVDGILWIRSDYSMVGYLNAPNPFDNERWLNTGDMVEVDGEWLRILGRDSDLINVAGQKVFPAEVEQAILEVDNVRDVAVYGEPHALLGQIVVARVATLEPEPVLAVKQRIRTECGRTLAAYKLPTKVILATDSELYSHRHKKNRRA